MQITCHCHIVGQFPAIIRFVCSIVIPITCFITTTLNEYVKINMWVVTCTKWCTDLYITNNKRLIGHYNIKNIILCSWHTYNLAKALHLMQNWATHSDDCGSWLSNPSVCLGSWDHQQLWSNLWLLGALTSVPVDWTNSQNLGEDNMQKLYIENNRHANLHNTLVNCKILHPNLSLSHLVSCA